MADEFDASKIKAAGWRQGAVLSEKVAEAATQAAPEHVQHQEDDWLIITSHDCDISNFSLIKEPVVEVIRARSTKAKSVDKQKAWGRNPRTIHFEAMHDETKIILECDVHDRWTFRRELLLLCTPNSSKSVDDQIRRILAEWLAKRYIRAAFPTQFDRRWRGEKSKNLKIWIDLLAKNNKWIQGEYIWLNTFEELSSDTTPYHCDFLISIPSKRTKCSDWSKQKEEIEDDILKFWSQFEPGIKCGLVEILGTDEITLDNLSHFHRFDADWLSFSDNDEYPITPIATDLRM